MKTKNEKKALQTVRNHTPKGAIDSAKSRRIVGGGNPWFEGP